jgi:flagellar biosynthesis protein FlhF
MRLKTFSAPSMTDALKMVKDHFGDDAIIVSSQKGDNGLGVNVTAAIDRKESIDNLNHQTPNNDTNNLDIILEALSHHGTPSRISDQIIDNVSRLAIDDVDTALATSIDQVLNFKKLPSTKTQEIFMLIGLPGAGKTVTTAKLAARAVMAGQKVNVISTDRVRAGGFEQLEAFTKILELDLLSANDPRTLENAVTASDEKHQTIIDCAGGNPFKRSDFIKQLDLINAVNANVIMLLADGTDPLEAADLAQAYSELGAKNLIVTRIDVSRRHGSILSAATKGKLSICGVGIGPNVSDGLNSINPVSLARLLLKDKDIRSDA